MSFDKKVKQVVNCPKAEKFRDLVQSKLPNAHIFWDPEPNPFCDQQSCTLVAVNRTSPEKKGSIDYPQGFPDQLVKVLAEDFVVHIGPKVTK
jgi:hypothetical protein